MRMHIRQFALFSTLALTALLAGCASTPAYEPKADLLGKARADVVSVMGSPAVEQPTQDGVRMVYPRGPYGKHTYVVTVDSMGKVIGLEQVLTEENFNRVVPGMTAAQVELLIGPSFVKTELARKRGEFWAYRFHSPFCIWFEVEFDIDAKVRSAGYGLPPECRSGRRGH
jgi:hypothetical protein